MRYLLWIACIAGVSGILLLRTIYPSDDFEQLPPLPAPMLGMMIMTYFFVFLPLLAFVLFEQLKEERAGKARVVRFIVAPFVVALCFFFTMLLLG
ncbi:hypothetical protein NG895_23960 [Aeoliella sp. ICT_H6.2]|uniref:Uncharacterized protein n=1 Tax=Aeoliella straminimaris TaxID=2954799 RepID=A0A9X2FJC6_9BACT|nr:hypothetical protein [Aeoliella straminimaris]MCO6046966.1 hypothetical protein [Aeoliella straminimaris]